MSNINPNNINGTFPVAGQDNDSQGFRDNFTNILNNFSYAKAEIEDLQSKAVLKTALNGGSLNNSMSFNELSNLKIRSYALTSYDYTNVQSSTVAIDFNLGNFFHFTTTQAVSLSLLHWPNTGYGSVRVWMGIADVAHTVQFPTSVSINTESIPGFGVNGLDNTITFDQTGNYLFEIASYDGGATYMLRDLIRAKSAISGNLNVSGNIISQGGAFIGGNATVTGNLTVQGNITTVNTEVLTVQDPIITMGGNANDAALTDNDGKDRGLLLRYYSGSALNSFMGWDNSAAEFIFGSRVTVTSEVVSVTTLGNIRSGNANIATINGNNVIASNVITAAGNVTGANFVTAGIATIGANITAANIYVSGTGGGKITATGNVDAQGLRVSDAATVVNRLTAGHLSTGGTLTVTGASSTGGNATVSGNIIVAGGIINTSFVEAVVINDQNLRANINYNTFVIDTLNSTSIANLWITLPETAVNGQTLTFSALAPITSCYVDTLSTGKVRWAPNAWATTGNTVIKLTYSTDINDWLRTG